MARKKKPTVDIRDFSRLDQDAVNFIDAKVRSLGSKEAVAAHYKANDTVSEYARTLARYYFPGASNISENSS